MNACPNAFAGSNTNGDEKHDDKEQSDWKRDFVDGDVTSHFHAIVANFQVNTSSIEITKDMLQLRLHTETKKRISEVHLIVKMLWNYLGISRTAIKMEAVIKIKE